MIDEEHTACGMVAVHCDLCGAHLGFQASGTRVDPENWIHTRCPVRLAEHWGISTGEVEELTEVISAAVASCYPEIADRQPLSDPGDRPLAKLRGDIAAGHAMEALAMQGFRITRQR
jgi:hypothetical protein